MAVTRLKRKGRRNKVVAKKKLADVQRLSITPVIKNVDIEAIKEEFKKNASSAPKAESSVAVEEKPKKKAAPKKEGAPKAEPAASETNDIEK